MKEILNKTFWQLLIVYSVVVTLVYFNLLNKFALEFQLFGLALAIFGFFVVSKKRDSIDISQWWVLAILGFVIITRLLPYINNSVPLGYDPGIYKHIFESFISGNSWNDMPPGLNYFVSLFYFMGLNSWHILVWLFVAIDVFLGYCVFLSSKEWFGKNAGLLALLVYAVSYTQFMAFWYNYYKNVFAMCLLLLALYFYKKEFKHKWIGWLLFVAFAGYLGGTHRPTFLIFGVGMSVYAIVDVIVKKNYRKFGRDLLLGAGVLVVALSFYMGNFDTLIMPGVQNVVKGNIGAGSFYGYNDFILYSLAYFPLALLGCVFLLRKFNPFFAWFIINFFIVFFRLIFYNRFIIQLDLAMVILSGAGLAYLLERKKIFTAVVISLLVISSGFFVLSESYHSKPLISEKELEEIKNLPVGEKDTLISPHKHYSPWLLGWTDARIIAPGLWNDKWTRKEWNIFWNSDNITKINELLSDYEKPLYFYAGKMDAEKFESYEIADNLYRFK